LAEAEFTKSAATGNPDAYLPLADAQRAQGKFNLAEDNYHKSLSHGEHKALVRMAEMYRKGEGKAVDDVQALSLLYKARKSGVSGLDTKIAHLEKKLQPEGISKAYDLARGD
jgi:TPR repeat protein